MNPFRAHPLGRALAALQAAGLGALAALAGSATLAAPAHSVESSRVCWLWSSSGWQEDLGGGESAYVVSAHCVAWLDDAVQATGSPTTGWTGPVGPGDRPYCDVVRGELVATQRLLDAAHDQLGSAQQDVVGDEPVRDTTALDHTHAELDAASVAATQAVTAYAVAHGAVLERELRAGTTVAVRLSVDPTTPEGRAVRSAQHRLDTATRDYDAASTRWGYRAGSGLALHQQRLAGVESAVATLPAEVEALQQEQAACPSR